MSNLHTKSAIDLTKTPFQLHDILSYAGSEITFIRQAPNGDWNIFMVTRWKMWSPNSVKKFFLHGKTQKPKVFKTIFCVKIFLLRNDRKNQILHVKALKCHVVEMVFCQIDSSLGLETSRNIFFLHAVSTKPSRTEAKTISAMRPRYSCRNRWKHGGAKCWLHCMDYNCFGGN